MNIRKLVLSFTILAISSCGLLYSQTSEEKKVLEEINFARTNPGGYIKKVLEPLVNGDLNQYQSAVVESISQLKTMRPMGELTWSNGLYKSAQEECQKKSTSKDISTDSDYSKRISKYVSWSACGEMVDYGYSDARSIVLSLILDMESPNRNHRRIIFSDKFSHFAAAIGSNETYGSDSVLDFAAGCISYADLPSSVYHEDLARQVISEINMVRTKPLEYISTRLEMLLTGEGEFQTEVASLISYLKNFDPVQGLAFNKDLCTSAKGFVDNVGITADNQILQSDDWEKNIRDVRHWGNVAQAFVSGETDPRAAVIRMLLDSSSNNRSNLLSPLLNCAGASVGENTLICVDLGSWHDAGNTPPEGLLIDGANEDLVEEINWARTNPREYAKARLEPLLAGEMNQYQYALQELIKEMNGMKAVAPLKVVNALNRAASEWTSIQGMTSSTAYDPNWQQRISKYGIMDGGTEVLCFGEFTPDIAVATMLIDEHLSKRNRRRALLSSSYNYVGTSTFVHGVYTGMALIELASNFILPDNVIYKSPVSSYGSNVTMAELEVLKEINFARTSPKDYVRTRLQKLVTGEKNSYQSALSELIGTMNSMQSLGDIKFSVDLHNAASEFVESASNNGKTSSDKFWLERVDRFASWTKAGEVISLGQQTPVETVLQLLIDDGITNRGHRKILFNKDFTHAGIAIQSHCKTGVICCVDLIEQDSSGK